MPKTKKSNNVFVTLGASSHTAAVREKHDYYATEPKATRHLVKLEKLRNVLEPACGEGHISEVLTTHGIDVTSSDLINRGYGAVKDFFEYTEWVGDIVTNPPFSICQKFVEHALKIVPEGSKVVMFLPLRFLESKTRKPLLENSPMRTLYVASGRILCAKNADFERMKKGGGSAVAYGWFVWEKGYKGLTRIKYFN